MSALCIIDTSVFCNIVRVPGRDQAHEQITRNLTAYINQDATFVLPVATIIETGNHIAQQGSGQQRRQTAERFVKQVRGAIEGKAPWTATNFLEAVTLNSCLDQFPDEAMREIGMGDLTIIKEWERLCELNPARRVFIWSLDGHLAAYDRAPRL